MNRRELIKGGLLAGVGSLAGCAPAVQVRANGAAPDATGVPVGRARNVIFFAYDGLTYEDVATARFFARRHLEGRTLALERMLDGQGAAAGSMWPHSLTSIVTDSAAATTAWSTGRKVVNYAIAMYPDGRPLTTILELAREAGRATGLITSTRLTHATPAGWVAKVPDRGMEDEIASQYLAFRPDVLLGGGSRQFDAATRADGRDLFVEFRAAGYEVLRTPEQLRASTGSRLLGTFALDHLPYEIDRRYQGVASPTLAELVARGLEVLNDSAGGFVLHVEAGRIDHANHGNDPGGMVWDTIAADDALEVMLDFVRRNPDTLLIMASDHGTGGGAVYGTGPAYRNTNPSFDRLARHRASYEHLLRELGQNPPAPRIIEAAERFYGIRVAPPQAARISDALERRVYPGHPLAHRSNPSNAIHWLLTVGNEADPQTVNLNYSTGSHTAGPVPLFAHGAGVGTRGLGMVDNTELFGWMLHALGMRFENPMMTEAEALQLPQRSRAPQEDEHAPALALG